MASEIGAGKLREIAVLVGLKTAAKLRRDFSLFGNELLDVKNNETIGADIEAENYIVEQLKHVGFKGKVVTEERGVIEIGDANLIAVVDPLDGSVNYSLGIPWFSVSIAFALRLKEAATFEDVVAGAVVPVLSAIPISFARGKGVFVGETKLTNVPQRTFSDHIMVAFYGDDPEGLASYSKIHSELTRRYKKVKARSLGSVALDIAYVALRRIDIFADTRAKLRNVDVAAALGILREAGGSFADIRGEELNFSVEEVVPVRSLLASWYDKYLREAIKALEE